MLQATPASLRLHRGPRSMPNDPNAAINIPPKARNWAGHPPRRVRLSIVNKARLSKTNIAPASGDMRTLRPAMASVGVVSR